MFIYQADTYCDPCGRRIAGDLDQAGLAPDDPEDEHTYDSDEYPKGPCPLEETDGPDHCAKGVLCIGNSVCLDDYGLAMNAPMFGQESHHIGELLSSGLTEYGTAYLAEMLAEEPRTPYQEALHRFWREAFAYELESTHLEEYRTPGRHSL